MIATALAVETFHTMPSRLWLVLVFMFQATLISMWSVVVGLLGALYLHGQGSARMKAGVGFDVLNLALWVVGLLVGCVGCCVRSRAAGKGEKKATKKKTAIGFGDVEQVMKHYSNNNNSNSSV